MQVYFCYFKKIQLSMADVRGRATCMCIGITENLWHNAVCGLRQLQVCGLGLIYGPQSPQRLNDQS